MKRPGPVARYFIGPASGLVIGITCAQLALGAPRSVLNHPSPPAKSPDTATTEIAQGDLSVATQTGALTYSFPIAVPPGRLGNQPNLALSYSSQAAIYGDIAAGWSLNIPEIRIDTSRGREFDYLNPVSYERKYVSTLGGGHRLIRTDEFTSAAITYRAQYDSSYAQYEWKGVGNAAWRVRTPNGMTYLFGDKGMNEGGNDRRGRWPLTRTIDRFGNEVVYHYGADLEITHIEYTLNSGAGITTPHARIDFEYAPFLDNYCREYSVQIGTLQDRRAGALDIKGPRELSAITTFARTKSSSSLREVRRIDLVYDDDAKSCESNHGPQRHLIEIHETGTTEGGTVTTAPVKRFDYGPAAPLAWTFPTPNFAMPPATADAPFEALTWGERYQSKWAWPTVRSMLIDFNGDGLVDRLYSPPPGEIGTGPCTFQWDRGTPTGFVPTGETVNLPTIPWAGPDDPAIDWGYQPPEGCSLAGQRVSLDTIATHTCEYALGSYLAYRFLDMDSDGLLDLVAALHYDDDFVTSWDAGLYERLGLPEPPCTPGPASCPDVSTSGCLDEATTCGVGTGCVFDQPTLISCVEDAPRVPCEDIMFAGDATDDADAPATMIAPDGTCYIEEEDGTVTELDCLPDDTYELPNLEVDEADPSVPNFCEARYRGRQGLSACDGRYVWYWYRNETNEGGTLADEPQITLSPVPLESEAGFGGMGTGPAQLTSNEHGVLDLNGDGHLDVFARDVRTDFLLDVDPTAWWYVWLGNGTGSFQGPYGGDSTPYIWITPGLAPAQETATGASLIEEDTSRSIRHIAETAGLYDVNGDGLPDLVWQNNDPTDLRMRVFFNYGLSFTEKGIVPTPFSWLYTGIEHEFEMSSWSQAPVSTLENSIYYVPQATRRQVSAPVDRDGDGRVDWFHPMPLLGPGPSWVVTWLINDGGGLGDAAWLTGEEWSTLPDVVKVDSGIWYVTRRLIDMNGDGRLDAPYIAPEGGKLRTEEFYGKPPRLLHRVDNGRGLVTDIRYAPHTDDSVVTQDPAAGKASPNPLWVVSSITSTDTFGTPTATKTYEYHHPIRTRDWLGDQGFRGFEQVKYVAPRGAITVEKYDYDVDWSGRLVEESVYADASSYNDAMVSAANEAASQPYSVSRTRWVEFELFSGEPIPLKTFHDTASSTWHCATGQSKADCESSGAQRSTITMWSPLGSGIARLHAPSTTMELTGSLAYVSGAPDLAGYVYQLDDRQTTTQYALDHDVDRYLQRVVETELLGLSPLESFGKTQYVYDALTTRVPEQIKVEVEPDVWAVTTQVFDMYTGLRQTVQKPQQLDSAYLTTFTHDAAKVFVATTTNERDHVVETDYDYGTGALLSARGPNSVGGVLEETRSTIDGFGRVTTVEVTVDNGTGGYELVPILWTNYTEADVDATPPVPAKRLTEALIEYGTSTKTWEETTNNGYSAPIQHRVRTAPSVYAIESYSYDEEGNLTQMTRPSPASDSLSVTFDYLYDSLGRSLGFRGPGSGGLSDRNGGDIAYGPEPLKTTVSDYVAAPLSGEPLATKMTWHDVQGRLVEVDEQLDDGTWATTTYEYDAQDRLTHAMDPDGIITDLSYDFANRRTITRGARTWEYEYDLNGNMTVQRMPRPASAAASFYSVSTLYDELDRPTSQWAGMRDLSTEEITELLADLVTHWNYDAGPNGIGRLASISYDYWRETCIPGFGCFSWWAPAWRAMYEYDPRGNVTSEERYFNLNEAGYAFSDTRTMAWEYNALGAPVSTTYPDGTSTANSTQVDTSYDLRGLTDTVTWQSPAGPKQLATMTYRKAGNRIQQSSDGVSPLWSDDYNRWWAYDDWGRVVVDYGRRGTGGAYSHYETYKWFGASDLREHYAYRKSGLSNRFYYQYDSRHQLTAVTDTTLGYTADFGYTPGGRVDSAAVSAPGAVIGYSRDVVYDYTGPSDPQAVDTLSRTTGGGTYPDYASYEYNEAGGMTRRIVWPSQYCSWLCFSYQTVYRYDGYDRLRAAITGFGSTTDNQYYGPDGQRWLSLTRNGSGTPSKLRFWFGDTEVEYNGDGAQTKTIARINAGTPLARIANGSELEYIATNGLDHVMAALRSDGSVGAQFIYSPFGEILRQSGADTAGHLRRFNSKDWDGASGLYYYGYRFYDPRAMVWTRADPLYRFLPDAAYDEPRRMNLYAFTSNNPLTFVDPDGLQQRPADKSHCASSEDPDACAQGIPPDVAAIQSDVENAEAKVAHEPLKNLARVGLLMKENPRETIAIHLLPYPWASALFLMVTSSNHDEANQGIVTAGCAGGAKSCKIRKGAPTPNGLAREGISYELKHVRKHLPGTKPVERLLRKGEAAHVFTDKATLSRVEAAIIERGKFTGVVRGTERYGLRFEKPIGYRLAPDGTRTPLHYGELKLSTDTGFYHIIPRTGPSTP